MGTSMPPSKKQRIEVVHAASPVCHWSWGYEPVLNRLEALYGKQVEFVVAQAIPHVDRAKWLEDYDMTKAEAIEFLREIVQAGGLPCAVPSSWDETTESAVPPAIAVKSAGIAFGPAAERKLQRAIMNTYFLEGKDPSREDVLAECVRAAGLDLAPMLKASGEDAEAALGEDGARLGHGTNFYSLVVRNGTFDGATSVLLERAYDPARVEHAIDWLAGKKLKKGKMPSLAHYVEEHGPVSIREIAVAYAWKPAEAKAKLVALEKKGDLARRTFPLLPKDPFWAAAK